MQGLKVGIKIVVNGTRVTEFQKWAEVLIVFIEWEECHKLDKLLECRMNVRCLRRVLISVPR